MYGIEINIIRDIIWYEILDFAIENIPSYGLIFHI